MYSMPKNFTMFATIVCDVPEALSYPAREPFYITR